MKATISTFLGYYKITSAGVIDILSRPAVEVPPVKVSKGSPTPVAIATFATALTEIVENNELIVVNTLNPDLEQDLAAILTAARSDAVTTGVANSVKLGLMIPESGPNKDYGVLVVTSKVAGIKTVTEIVIEQIG